MSRAKKGTKKNVDTVKILFVSMISVMCAFAAFTLFIYIRSFIPIKSIAVHGMVYYEQGDVIGQSGVKRGDRLYSVSKRRTEKRILENCAYVEQVEVRRVFPNKLIIKVDEKIPKWYVEVSGSRYMLDDSLTVIEETHYDGGYHPEGVPCLVLPNVRSLIVGEQPEFGKDEQELKRSLELIYEIGKSSLKYRMTKVDIESRFDINIEVDGIYSVYMGDESNIKEKLLVIDELLKSDRLKEYKGAEIDVSIPETPNVRPVY